MRADLTGGRSPGEWPIRGEGRKVSELKELVAGGAELATIDFAAGLQAFGQREPGMKSRTVCAESGPPARVGAASGELFHCATDSLRASRPVRSIGLRAGGSCVRARRYRQESQLQCTEGSGGAARETPARSSWGWCSVTSMRHTCSCRVSAGRGGGAVTQSAGWCANLVGSGGDLRPWRTGCKRCPTRPVWHARK